MAEPYFKDPLLAKWAEGCHGSVLTEIGRIWRSQETRGQLDPLHVYSGLEQSLRSGHCEAPASVKKASERLRSLVLAELSGARRARVRLSALLTEAEEMREVLREIEWSGIINDYDYCPVCNGGYQDHRPDCRLARLIGGDSP